jgi:hypothetical protein
LLGDLQTVSLGVIPALVGGLVAMLRRRDLRAGSAAVSASACAVALALIVRAIIRIVGGFVVVDVNSFASRHQMVLNIGHAVTLGSALGGLTTGALGPTGMPILLRAFHLVGVALVVLAALAALFDLLRAAAAGLARSENTGSETWQLDDMLVLALLGSTANFVLLADTSDPTYVRYLTPGVIFGAILAGRAVGRFATTIGPSRLRRVGACAGLLVVGAFMAGFVFQVRSPAPPQPATQLGHFLEARGLHEGMGSYWSASIVTVETGDRVKVRPVILGPSGRLVRWSRNSATAWYATQRFRFLVYNTATPWGGVDKQSAVGTFGPPAKTYHVGTYVVLVWDRPLPISDS